VKYGIENLNVPVNFVWITFCCF